MNRYAAEISYCGSNYHGWQIQPNAPSVQEVINKALSTILREEINVVGAGRTDTGVHARYYVLHFETSSTVDTQFLSYKLNSFLPNDIAFHRIYAVDSSFHARFDAVSRAYEYHVSLRKDPFLRCESMRLNFIPDFQLMNEAAALLLDFEDFTSFSKLHTDVFTNNCQVSEAIWLPVDEFHWYFKISANRFLRNMVRAIVGTLLEVGAGRLTMSQFAAIIEAKDRSQAGQSVPAQGLFLVAVSY